MTIDELQRIAVLLANQTFVRWYAWINYPHEPQLMAIQFHYDSIGAPAPIPPDETRLGLGLSNVSQTLQQELEARGFRWDKNLRIWTVERSD